jgi:hypothetical protein
MGQRVKTMTETQSTLTPGTDDDMLRVARELESENPLWIVVFGVYTQQFIGFPRFDVSVGIMAVARYPGALTARMRLIEQKHAQIPKERGGK